MHDFHGTVFLLDNPDSVIDAKVTVDLNRIVIRMDDAEIGSWLHSDVEIKPVEDRVHLVADGETLVLALDGQDFFQDLLGVSEPEQKKSRRQQRQQRKQVDYEAERRTTFSLANLKEQALADSADPIDKRIAIVMGLGAALVLAGAALTWGPFRFMEPGSFPIGRVLAAYGGLGGLIGLYLAYFDRNGISGSAAAISAGIVTFCVIFAYTRVARLGIGFVLTLLGSQALIAAGAAGIMSHGRREDAGDEPAGGEIEPVASPDTDPNE